MCPAVHVIPFFCHILSSFLSPSVSCRPIQPWGMPEKKRKKIGQKKRELHELTYTEMVKCGTIRLTLVVCWGAPGGTVYRILIRMACAAHLGNSGLKREEGGGGRKPNMRKGKFPGN